MTTRRNFLRAAGVAVPATLATPAIVKAQSAIKWRFQTYAGSALGEQVTKPAIDYINANSNGELEIELFYADQIVPTGELFQALQRGTIDGVHSDDDSMASPTPLRVFGGYFPFATKHILDVPVLFNQYGLADIWREEYGKVGVQWLSAAGQDPCNFNTKKEITSVDDLDGLKLYTFPTAGRFLAKFGVVPVNIPYEDAEVAVQTGELDGMAWSGITEDYTVGWADVTDYFLTNNISGAWIGSWFANQERWAELPDHLKSVVMAGVEAGHTYRNQWYWGGEAALRANGDKLELRSVPASEWAEVENAAKEFWDEIAQEGEVHEKIVGIFREYNSVINQAGVPYNFE
ncbi:TRAP transporter substrate-binding protein [Roseovarius indicus]|uniref:C4-dicarboxylate ABC transporter n=1 Tax=Roseovarius indicus TaxID=540747 RepID=A0A0T5NXN5_9RHOB|nr:TRAP transporter substrate-binding protein [Roseovarius indicus]KRS13657.1 C4-dicarboxylate ABC transporter [Roseovarius indicus]OAN98493.1 C4-dicarboxylate ABC transporter [Roseovarius indicus]QEW25771.1 Neu5Ac-binding protein [Roseovarius indicus]SFE83586.1 TRAP-type mannitol/chloroaromatic compound transport system, substrate-binding protein [Roseovarius indicus]